MKIRNRLFSFKRASVHLFLSLCSRKKNLQARLEKCLDLHARSLPVFSTKIKSVCLAFLWLSVAVSECKCTIRSFLIVNLNLFVSIFSLFPPLFGVIQPFSLCIRSLSPQASSVLFSPSVLTLRLLPAPSAKLQMLVPLFSPYHLKKNTHRGGGGGKKLRDQERLRGKKGAVRSLLWSHFFPPSSLLLLFSHLPFSPYLSLLSLPPPPPLLSLPVSIYRSPPEWRKVPSQCSVLPVNLSTPTPPHSHPPALHVHTCTHTVHHHNEIKQGENGRYDQSSGRCSLAGGRTGTLIWTSKLGLLWTWAESDHRSFPLPLSDHGSETSKREEVPSSFSESAYFLHHRDSRTPSPRCFFDISSAFYSLSLFPLLSLLCFPFVILSVTKTKAVGVTEPHCTHSAKGLRYTAKGFSKSCRRRRSRKYRGDRDGGGYRCMSKCMRTSFCDGGISHFESIIP